MTILLQLRFRLSTGNAESYPQTELSSRPERSVVERSAVSFLAAHADSKAPGYASRSLFSQVLFFKVRTWTQEIPVAPLHYPSDLLLMLPRPGGPALNVSPARKGWDTMHG